MATATMPLCTLDNGATTVTLTYDDVTLVIASVTCHNGATFTRTFTATVGTKTWTVTMQPGSTQTVAVPKNIANSLVFTQDTTQTPPALYISGYTLTVT